MFDTFPLMDQSEFRFGARNFLEVWGEQVIRTNAFKNRRIKYSICKAKAQIRVNKFENIQNLRGKREN